ncbi:hypothetical protein ASPZODRAFT_478774 [Penicilliopsis zonata CBS 506.65]|uniref:Uncharacterized protein n=1 Tax=Penicilliopsis zonata CBS 506.65 TaxID=1073090 RepID=A0A1L9SEX4_9EURO|nr:hypothetical protein ASPZODRAFT_478774 [Penicilliopsis zonata CBS 506.65]OJJ45574.1 hypothetical protein ASPZODRAFT_478774 [Penicilliopsis zonata CBS 506.65]
MVDYRVWKPDLEHPEKINALQKERWRHFKKLDSTVTASTDIHGLLQTEVKLRECIQCEMGIKDIIKDHQKRVFTEPGGPARYLPLIQAYQGDLAKVDQKYWLLERQWWSIRAAFIEGPFSHGIELWRSHPRWYMHRVLRDDCAGRGGCCGRKCGCCSNRQNLSTRKFAAGHCTVYCFCCQQARGFQLSHEQRVELRKRFDLSFHNGYFQRIRDASLLGILQHDDNNPFDLIDDPPAYKTCR